MGLQIDYFNLIFAIKFCGVKNIFLYKPRGII